jgi:SMODS-associating 2TM, beta-strand rich effector domain
VTTIPLTPYSTDSDERDGIVIWIAIASVIVAYIIHQAIAPLHWEYGWVIDAPSAVGVYTILRRWFSLKLWRMPLVRRMNMVSIPDLNGIWAGVFASSYDEFKEERECGVEIKQNWFSMSILYQAGKSESVSVMAGISVKNAAGPQLTYCYVNRAHYDQRLADHDGTQSLLLSSPNGALTLEGDYYTNRKDGQTRGHMILRRVSAS